MPFDQFKVLPAAVSSQKPSGRLEDLITFALLTALVTLIFAPVFFSGRLLAPDDGIYQNLPNFFGTRSLWTPYLCAGFPLVADPLVQYFYPPALVFPHLPGGWNLYILLGYVLSGFFLYKYVKVLTASWYSSLVAALAFTFSGYLLSEVNHMHVVHNAFWLTFLLLAFEKLARNFTRGWFFSAACGVTLMIFCGHMQHSCYTLALCFFYILLRALGEKAEAFTRRRHYFLCSSTALILGLAMAAVQLLPTRELAGFSARANFSFQDFLAFSMMPLQGTGLFFPYLFGGASGGVINVPSFAAFAADTSFVYLGFTPMILAAAVAGVFRKNILVIFWLAIGIIAFLLSFGDATPLGWIVYHIPQYGSFRCLHRALLYSALATAVLLGLALAALIKGKISARALANSLLLFAASLIVVLAGAASVSSALVTQALTKGIEHFSLYPWANAALGLQSLYFVFSAASLIFFWRVHRISSGGSSPGTNQRLFSQVILALVLCADLSTTGWYAGESRWRISSPDVGRLQPVAEVAVLAPLLAREHQRILPVRGASGSADEIPTNISRFWGVESASGYEPLIFSRYSELLNMTEGGFLRVPWNYSGNDRCFDLLAIRYATTARGDERLLQLKSDGRPNWQKVGDRGDASVFENLRAMPRAWLAHSKLSMSAAEVLKTIKTAKLPDGKAFHPEQTALFEENSAYSDLPVKGATATSDTISSKSVASITSSGADQISLAVVCPQPSWLILSDVDYPGWTAQVNGTKSEIRRCDYLLRAVLVPRGYSKVQFKYEPQMYKIGLGISIFSFLVLLGLTIWWPVNVQKYSHG